MTTRAARSGFFPPAAMFGPRRALENRTREFVVRYPMALETFEDVAEQLPRFIEDMYNTRRRVPCHRAAIAVAFRHLTMHSHQSRTD